MESNEAYHGGSEYMDARDKDNDSGDPEDDLTLEDASNAALNRSSGQLSGQSRNIHASEGESGDEVHTHHSTLRTRDASQSQGPTQGLDAPAKSRQALDILSLSPGVTKRSIKAQTVDLVALKHEDGARGGDIHQALSPQAEPRMALLASNTTCLPPAPGSACWRRVIWVVREGIHKHPDWYTGLSASSTFTDVQAFVHKENNEFCPQPCDHAEGSFSGNDFGDIPQSRNRSILENCTWPGYNCLRSSCCKLQSMSCFERDSNFAVCKESCPSEAGWTCRVLGGYIEPPLAPRAPPGQHVPTSFYCLLLMAAEGTSQAEDRLVQVQRSRGVGAFACDDSRVFRAPHGVDPHSVDALLSALEEIRREGSYRKHGYTVKLTPDAVFLPERFKASLLEIRVPQGQALYFQTCRDSVRIDGAMEVFSRNALEAYFEQGGHCAEHISRQGREDAFIKQCMDALGVFQILNTTLLKSNLDLIDGGVVPDAGKQVSICSDVSAVAFHRFEDVDTWGRCYTISTEGSFAVP
jgi:hypothetical protein